MNSQILIGIVIMVVGSGLGTYLIQKGRTKLAFDSTQKLIKHLNSLDSKSREEIIRNSDFNKNEIILLVNKQTKSSAAEIVNEVQNKFGLINEDLVEKEKQIQLLRQIEEVRKDESRKFEILKRTPPEIEIVALFIRDNELRLTCEAKNKVPFRYKFSIVNENSQDIANSIQLEKTEVHPVELPYRFNQNYNTLKQIKYSKRVAFKNDVVITVNLRYESIYFHQINDSKLQGVICQSFLVNFEQNKFIKLD